MRIIRFTTRALALIFGTVIAFFYTILLMRATAAEHIEFSFFVFLKLAVVGILVFLLIFWVIWLPYLIIEKLVYRHRKSKI